MWCDQERLFPPRRSQVHLHGSLHAMECRMGLFRKSHSPLPAHKTASPCPRPFCLTTPWCILVVRFKRAYVNSKSYHIVLCIMRTHV